MRGLLAGKLPQRSRQVAAVVRNRVSLGALAQLVLSPRLLLGVPRFCLQLARYRRNDEDPVPLRLYPCLGDRRSAQPVKGSYFYQDTWAARQVFREQPDWFVDIGSTVLLVGILSQFAPCISVDIRPIDSHLEGLAIRHGSALELPFANDEVPCITTMCVLEHIGLGRYGDPIDPAGTTKAVAEISRVLQPGGLVVFSVPVGEPVLEFNAHRRFSVERALQFFPQWALVDSCLLTPTPIGLDSILTARGDLVACFALRKPKNTEG